MAPSTAMSALTAGPNTEDLPPRSVLVGRGEMQTSLSSEEPVKPKVAILPFSVEALMADRKPSREAVSPGAPGTSHALLKGLRMGSFGSLDTSCAPALSMSSSFSVGDILNMPEDVLIKPESPDSNERTSWLQSPRFSPTPPRFLNARVLSASRKVESSCLSSPKAQDQQKAPDPLHHVPAAGPGEEVPPEAVPFHRRARGVLQLPQLDGDPGQDLVPEPESQSQAAAGGRTRETENGS
ncbi:homeobox protein MSX-1a isoform X2 [Cyclopterus lumpus]|uniref:homeobox protein MSX-1a isoform X2 n=1 Tax=Cyclopterus lumpus TaxID=8103 RepID=UPI001486E2F3|nr:homeobox protein MSX-1a isoform X2 [Cyclopterus lumpus]